MTADRLCDWCRKVVLADVRARFCSRRCRQTAHRLRRRAALGDASPVPSARFAYADPPYPGLAARYYRHEPTFAGEVNHRALIASLEASGYAGWALSTSSKALRDVLPLCPAGARVCAWVKPIGVPPRTRGIHSTWEPVIVVGGRQRPPGVRDWLRATPARGGGETLMGRKPLSFCAWLFDLLGMQPGDELVDLFPGTGIVGRAWAELSRGAPTDVSPGALRDAPSPTASPTASATCRPRGIGDVSFGADVDASTSRGGRRFLPAVLSPGYPGDASFGAEGRQVGASRGAPADGSVTSMDGRRVGPAADGMGDGRAA